MPWFISNNYSCGWIILPRHLGMQMCLVKALLNFIRAEVCLCITKFKSHWVSWSHFSYFLVIEFLKKLYTYKALYVIRIIHIHKHATISSGIYIYIPKLKYSNEKEQSINAWLLL